MNHKSPVHRFLTVEMEIATAKPAALPSNWWIETLHCFHTTEIKGGCSNRKVRLTFAEIAEGSAPDGRPIWWTATASDAVITGLIMEQIKILRPDATLLRPIKINRNPPPSALLRGYARWQESLARPRHVKREQVSGRYERRKKRLQRMMQTTTI